MILSGRANHNVTFLERLLAAKPWYERYASSCNTSISRRWVSSRENFRSRERKPSHDPPVSQGSLVYWHRRRTTATFMLFHSLRRKYNQGQITKRLECCRLERETSQLVACSFQSSCNRQKIHPFRMLKAHSTRNPSARASYRSPWRNHPLKELLPLRRVARLISRIQTRCVQRS